MKETNSLSTKLPPTEVNFSIENVEGDISKMKYNGDFKCRIPNLKIQALIAKHNAFLNGEMAHMLDETILRLHHMISYLRYTLLEYPRFWKDSDLGYELQDMAVVKHIYDRVLAIEVDWLKQVWGDEFEQTYGAKVDDEKGS